MQAGQPAGPSSALSDEENLPKRRASGQALADPCPLGPHREPVPFHRVLRSQRSLSPYRRDSGLASATSRDLPELPAQGRRDAALTPAPRTRVLPGPLGRGLAVAPGSSWLCIVEEDPQGGPARCQVLAHVLPAHVVLLIGQNDGPPLDEVTEAEATCTREGPRPRLVSPVTMGSLHAPVSGRERAFVLARDGSACKWNESESHLCPGLRRWGLEPRPGCPGAQASGDGRRHLILCVFFLAKDLSCH